MRKGQRGYKRTRKFMRSLAMLSSTFIVTTHGDQTKFIFNTVLFRHYREWIKFAARTY